MFERLPLRRESIKGTAALFIAGAALTGCGVVEAATSRIDHSLPRCYDEPAPAVAAAANAQRPDFYATGKKVTVQQTSRGIIKNGGKEPSPTVHAKILGGIVRVDNADGQDSMGSGALVKNAAGEKVVVTAAHVVEGASTKELTVTDSFGNKATIASGCFMYENYGKFEDPSTAMTSMPAAIDLAILKLPDPEAIGGEPLPLAQEAPVRGSWNFTFANFQRWSDTPILYKGMALGRLKDHRVQYLTGIADGQSCEPNGNYKRSQCAAQPGSSGGPVVQTSTGNLVSMSASSVIPATGLGYMQRGELRQNFNVATNVVAGYGSGNWPTVSQGPLFNVIDVALQSPHA
ncbi:MAG TPA: serine protease [Candidatus Saccharimonadales bacterium]|nr:serine protease [Candidatus Saccharimonadales bacterium]